MPYATDTSVSVEKSRAELEITLAKFGASTFGYMADEQRAVVQFKAKDRTIRFNLPIPGKHEKRFTHKKDRYGYLVQRTSEGARKEWEQACRSAWRSLLLAVKAKLVAVESGITTFEQEFLAHIVLPDGSTAGDVMIPQIQTAYAIGQMPEFALSLPAHASHD